MAHHALYFLINWLQLIFGALAAIQIARQDDRTTYWPVALLALWETVPFFTLLVLRNFGPGNVSAIEAYRIYFGAFWIAYFLQSIVGVLLTYNMFHAAMRPLKGLQSLGTIMYIWAGAVSLAIAVTVALEPHPPHMLAITILVNEFQKSSSILTLSLVLFVCLAVRPMGLSIRSRVLGTGIGLAILSVLRLLQGDYFLAPRNLFDAYSLLSSGVSCVANVIWLYYFLRPEPKRKFILLPTTSPFHKWNQISEILGQEPGYVAIAGVPPEAFASAEIEIFHRASAKMNAQDRFTAAFKDPDAPTLSGQ